MKTTKSYAKRLKVTKNGKIVARKPGQNHFNAKESSNSQRNKRRTQIIKMSNKDKSRFLVNL
ncbi:MAG: 50S ribosomal protein L35 [bacterium]